MSEVKEMEEYSIVNFIKSLNMDPVEIKILDLLSDNINNDDCLNILITFLKENKEDD